MGQIQEISLPDFCLAWRFISSQLVIWVRSEDSFEKEEAMKLAERFVKNHKLTDREEYRELLEQSEEKETAEYLRQEAIRLRKQYYGSKVYIRGLIEFTNYCKNNCYYCGIRRDNQRVLRYRLTREEVLDCVKKGLDMGFRTFVLQGGEDPYFTDQRVAELVHSIKRLCPDCAVTLSIGERPFESYRRFRQAGADRYLLRHETAGEKHYRSLHPADMSLAVRKQCLWDLKSLGYQTGAGFMVGSPGQTYRELAEDLIFLQELQPEMAGLGPFIPHGETRFAGAMAGSLELTVRLLSIVRILLPAVLLPATTALATLDPAGREKGLGAGANVVMPNLTPLKNREQYSLYDNKRCTGTESAEGLSELARSLESQGYEFSMERGDYPLLARGCLQSSEKYSE